VQNSRPLDNEKVQILSFNESEEMESPSRNLVQGEGKLQTRNDQSFERLY